MPVDEFINRELAFINRELEKINIHKRRADSTETLNNLSVFYT